MSASFTASPPTFPTEPPRQVILVYAGFWWRFLAFLIDFAVLSVVDGLIRWATGLGFSSDGGPVTPGLPISNIDYQMVIVRHPSLHGHAGLLLVIMTALAIAYSSLLESSRWQATIGKRVCRLRVTDLFGARIGWPRALGRYLGKFVSAFLLGIGFLMIGWTRRKQGLHDIMAGTLIMRLRESDPVFHVRPAV
jgi:uncharacterized RDD family membrane protein YckC